MHIFACARFYQEICNGGFITMLDQEKLEITETSDFCDKLMIVICIGIFFSYFYV